MANYLQYTLGIMCIITHSVWALDDWIDISDLNHIKNCAPERREPESVPSYCSNPRHCADVIQLIKQTPTERLITAEQSCLLSRKPSENRQKTDLETVIKMLHAEIERRNYELTEAGKTERQRAAERERILSREFCENWNEILRSERQK